jgi:hypothetical protein
LALGIIDSIFSTGSSYQSVVNVVNAYRALRREQGADPNRDGVPELLASFKEYEGSAGWALAVVPVTLIGRCFEDLVLKKSVAGLVHHERLT